MILLIAVNPVNGGLSWKNSLEDGLILFCEMHKDIWE